MKILEEGAPYKWGPNIRKNYDNGITFCFWTIWGQIHFRIRGKTNPVKPRFLIGVFTHCSQGLMHPIYHTENTKQEIKA